MPTAIALNFANAPATTLAADIAPAATLIQLATGGSSAMPILFPFLLLLDRDQPTEEVVLVTAKPGVDQYTVSRGYDNTTAFAHNAGSTVSHGVSALVFRDANAHMQATAGVHGVTGNVVGTTDVQTLTNKTLSSGTVLQAGTTINSPAINNPVITGGTIQDSLLVKGNTVGSQDPIKFMDPTNAIQYGGVTRTGRVQASALWASGVGTDQVTLLVKPMAGQTASLVSHVNSAGTHVGEVTAAGKVGIGMDAANGIQHLVKATANSDVTQRIERKTGQTGNLWQVVTEGSLVLASIDSDGKFYSRSDSPTAWETLTLASGLTIHDHLTRVRLVGKRVHVDGTIEKISGAAMDGTSGFLLFTLPTEYRPGSAKKYTGQATLGGAGTAGACRIEVGTNGQVHFWSQESPVWVGVFGGFWID